MRLAGEVGLFITENLFHQILLLLSWNFPEEPNGTDRVTSPTNTIVRFSSMAKFDLHEVCILIFVPQCPSPLGLNGLVKNKFLPEGKKKIISLTKIDLMISCK